MEKKYKTLNDFYAYYLTEHQSPISQTLHFIGTGIVFTLLIGFLFTFNWRFLLAMPIAGYGFAWVGHAFFEKNRPATFTYPLYSLASDFIMFWHIMSGQMPKKMAEAKRIIAKEKKQK
ncbi:MAG: Mpo1-like protein [Chitinophagales bacterium]